MRSRLLLVFALAVLTVAVGQAARADDLPDNFSRDYQRRNDWPKPFVYPDRMAVRAAFLPMVATGWEMQNMIGDYHFDGPKLTTAGQYKVQWILNEAPPQHRAIYVHCGTTPQETYNRIEAVRQAASALLPMGETALIYQTNLSPQGWAADRADIIGRKYLGVIPNPKLPPKSSSGGGDSGGGSGGGDSSGGGSGGGSSSGGGSGGGGP